MVLLLYLGWAGVEGLMGVGLNVGAGRDKSGGLSMQEIAKQDGMVLIIKMPLRQKDDDDYDRPVRLNKPGWWYGDSEIAQACYMV